MRGRKPPYVIVVLLAVASCARSQTTGRPQVQGRGIEVSVPTGWEYDRAVLQLGGPIALTNFGGRRLHGGLLPPGGAEIEITSVPRPIELSGYARSELRGVRDLKLQEGASNGRLALRANYVDEVADGVSTSNVVYYVAQGSRLYKFYMTFGLGDPHEQELVQTMESIVRESVLK
jgi:hypothetical protein